MDKYYNNRVSVIIPLYNAENWIEESILSVEKQKYPDIEIVVVDDCSTDSSPAVVKRLQKNIPYLKYFRLDQNSGVAIARNKAIEISNGRYIAFLDSDDIWHENKLEKQLALFNNKLNIPFTYTAIEMIDDKGSIVKGKRSVKEYATFDFILRNTMIATSTVIIDRSVVSDVSMPNRRSAEDYSLWLTLLRDYGPAWGINEALTSYRISNGSISHNRIKEIKYFYAVQREDMKIKWHSAVYNTCWYIINAIKKHYM